MSDLGVFLLGFNAGILLMAFLFWLNERKGLVIFTRGERYIRVSPVVISKVDEDVNDE